MSLAPRATFAALVVLCALAFAFSAFLQPGSIAFAPFAIQDDARQFLAGLAPPGERAADLIARYWHAVSPPAWRALFDGAAAIGIAPPLFARLLPLALLAASAFGAWRMAGAMDARPAAMLVIATALMALVVHDDSIWSATPRGFSPPLLLLALAAMARRQRWPAALWLGLLACIYPASALAGLAMLGLSYLRLGPVIGIELAPRAIAPGFAAVAAVGAGALLVAGGAGDFGPVLRLDEAMRMPGLALPGGRTSLIGTGAGIGWLCSARMGFLPEIVPCWLGGPGPLIANALLLLPSLWLAVQGVRAARRGVATPDLLHAWALIAALAGWSAAAAFAFEFHVPGRYSQRVLQLTEWLAIGQLVARIPLAGMRAPVRRALKGLGWTLALVSFATPLPGIRHPRDAEALRWLIARPQPLVIASLEDEAAAWPALTRHRLLASIEHAIPYHLGYFRPVEAGLAATAAMLATDDPDRLARLVKRSGIDVLAVDRAFVGTGAMPERLGSVLPATLARAERDLARRPSLTQMRARKCVVKEGQVLLFLDARCLADQAPAADRTSR